MHQIDACVLTLYHQRRCSGVQHLCCVQGKQGRESAGERPCTGFVASPDLTVTPGHTAWCSGIVMQEYSSQ